MKKVICFIFALSCTFLTIAQTDLVHKNKPLPQVNKSLTIVAHIILDSLKSPVADSNTIKQEIANMNKYFAPIGLSFQICKVNLIANYAFEDLKDSEELEEMLNMHHVDNRINMFFVNQYSGGEFYGAADSLGILDVEYGGIVVNKQAIKATFMAHLMGHYFGLTHTYTQGGELVKGSNCATAGDKICDTPADPFKEGDNYKDYLDPLKSCLFVDKSKDAQNEYYTPDLGNIMSAYRDCFCSFSYEQLKLMANNYNNAPRKMW